MKSVRPVSVDELVLTIGSPTVERETLSKDLDRMVGVLQDVLLGALKPEQVQLDPVQRTVQVVPRAEPKPGEPTPEAQRQATKILAQCGRTTPVQPEELVGANNDAA